MPQSTENRIASFATSVYLNSFYSGEFIQSHFVGFTIDYIMGHFKWHQTKRTVATHSPPNASYLRIFIQFTIDPTRQQKQ